MKKKYSSYFVRLYIFLKNISGSNHADELHYVFGKMLQGKPATEADKQVSRAVATMWSNFAKSG